MVMIVSAAATTFVPLLTIVMFVRMGMGMGVCMIVGMIVGVIVSMIMGVIVSARTATAIVFHMMLMPMFTITMAVISISSGYFICLEA